VEKNIRGFEGTYPKVGKPIYIDPSSAVIGNVELGDHVSVWPHAVIRGDDAAIHVGSWTNIQDNWIGEYCVVGHGALIHGCAIDDGCMVGMGSILLNGVVVGKGCLIGAGTLLTEGKSFPHGSLILGSPGSVVRALSPEEIAGIRAAATSYWEKAMKHLRQR
jgi:carbonic anhydrase/acetyltransferase-like protein (isoleucine patch superfamily)